MIWFIPAFRGRSVSCRGVWVVPWGLYPMCCCSVHRVVALLRRHMLWWVSRSCPCDGSLSNCGYRINLNQCWRSHRRGSFADDPGVRSTPTSLNPGQTQYPSPCKWSLTWRLPLCFWADRVDLGVWVAWCHGHRPYALLLYTLGLSSGLAWTLRGGLYANMLTSVG